MNLFNDSVHLVNFADIFPPLALDDWHCSDIFWKCTQVEQIFKPDWKIYILQVGIFCFILLYLVIYHN